MMKKCRVLVVLLVALFASQTFAGLVNVGNYSFSVAGSKIGYWAGDVGTTDPIDFTHDLTGAPGDLHNVLGQNDGRFASWANGSNELGSNGVTVTFDLLSAYNLNSITTYSTVPSYWGVGAVDFYYSENGVDYTLLGSDGVNTTVAGEYTRSMDADGVEARYVKLQVHSSSWRHLELDCVEIDATPVPEPATMLILGIGSLVGLRKRLN